MAEVKHAFRRGATLLHPDKIMVNLKEEWMLFLLKETEDLQREEARTRKEEEEEDADMMRLLRVQAEARTKEKKHNERTS